MRIYCETVGEQGAKPGADFVMGPRPDGAMYLILSSSDMSAISAATQDHQGNVVVRFEHPNYDPKAKRGTVPPSNIHELFRQAAARAAKLFGNDVRHRVVEIEPSGMVRACN